MTLQTAAQLAVESEEPHQPAHGPTTVAARRLLRKKLAVAALAVIALFYAAGLFAPVIAPYDYKDQDLDNQEQGPTLEHPFGTDSLGRDILTRVIWSARTTTIVTVATVVAGGLFLAVGLGMLAGYRGGATDTAIMRTGEVFAALPGLPMLILINATLRPRAVEAVDWLESHIGFESLREPSTGEAIFLAALGLLVLAGLIGLLVWLFVPGQRSGWWLVPGVLAAVSVTLLWCLQGIFATPGAADYFLIFGAMSLFVWVGGARVIRSQVLSLRETEFVLAAQAMGGGTRRVMLSHLLPNLMPIIIVSVSASLGAIAGSEIALTFLGVGVHEPTPSFGAMIFDAAATITTIRSISDHPYILLAPAATVAALIFAFNLLGDALNDVLTPRAR